jgi:hypothetical protein
MEQRKENMLAFMAHYEFPTAAVKTVLWAWETLLKDEKSRKTLEQAFLIYENDWMFDHKAQLDALIPAAQRCRIPRETVHLVYILGLMEPLRVKYARAGIPEAVYWNSMLDVRCKLLECRQVRKLWGLSVAYWYERFLLLTRFALGRLQFELKLAPVSMEREGLRVEAGQPVVNMHIPSCGPLNREACEESFRRAYGWFRPAFPDGCIPFFCSSWLLAPEHPDFLPADSNILKFMDFFKISPTESTVEGNLWRIFGTESLDVSCFPRDTGLRRAYGDVLDRGEMPHVGRGIFFMKDGKRISPREINR